MPDTGLTIAPRITEAVTIDPRRTALSVDPFEPQSMADLYKFAETVSRTPFCPKEFQGKADDAFIAMLYGKSLGLAALQALQGIGVINGKPATYGETFWAVIISHPDFVDCEEDPREDQATVILSRRNRKPYTAIFTMAEAQTAGLKGKAGPWTNYPKGQMLWRARHRAATALFADAIKGILPREIAMDYIDGEVVTSQPVAASPAAKPEPKVDADPFITADQGKEWNAAWDAGLKAAGVTLTGDRAVVKRDELKSFGATKSGEIRVSEFANSIARASAYTRPQTEAAQSPSAPVASGSKAEQDSNAFAAESSERSPAAAEEMPEDERMVRGWMKDLAWGSLAQSTRIGRHTADGVTDWGAIAISLQPELLEKGIIEA